MFYFLILIKAFIIYCSISILLMLAAQLSDAGVITWLSQKIKALVPDWHWGLILSFLVLIYFYVHSWRVVLSFFPEIPYCKTLSPLAPGGTHSALGSEAAAETTTASARRMAKVAAPASATLGMLMFILSM